MGRIIQNLRIGTKLAITSALGVLLVGFMIGSQMYGNATVSRSHQSAIVQQSILRDAVEAKTALLGMQVSVRDIRLAGTSADLKKAGDNLAERLQSANNSADEMARLSQSAENRARIEKLKSLTGAYMRGAQQIVAVRSEAIGLGAAGAGSESAARIAKLNDEAIRIAREVTLPMVAELESLAGQIAAGAASATAWNPACVKACARAVSSLRSRTPTAPAVCSAAFASVVSSIQRSTGSAEPSSQARARIAVGLIPWN